MKSERKYIMKFKFTITGLDCPNCAAKLSSMIEADERIQSCKINFLTEKVTAESELPEAETLAIVREYAKKFSSKLIVE